MNTYHTTPVTKPTTVPFFRDTVVVSPPLFTKFGAVAKDLFKKDFTFEHSLKLKTKTATGHTFENGAVLGNDNAVRGYLKYSYDVPKYGVFNADIYSDASSESKASMEFSKLADGLKIRTIAASNAANKDLKPNTAALEVDYIVNRIAFGANVKTDGNNHKINLNGALSHNGVAVGGEVHLNSNPAVSVAEKNFGIQFTQRDYLCAIVTEKNASVLATHVYQLTPHHYALGSSFRVDMNNKADRSLAVGGIFNCGQSTSVKVKAEVPTGIVSANIAHRLDNPNVLANFSLTSNVRDTLSLRAEKFGIGLTLGSI
jgi:hypothetical protein